MLDRRLGMDVADDVGIGLYRRDAVGHAGIVAEGVVDYREGRAVWKDVRSEICQPSIVSLAIALWKGEGRS